MGHDVLPSATWTIGEYPRHLHRGAGEFVVVANDTERDQKLAEGWSLWPWNDWRRDEDTPVHPPLSDVALPAPKKRGRPKKLAPVHVLDA